jgi:allophanate hydrolase
MEMVEVDFAPFMEAQRMLYEGPWIAERAAVITPFSHAHPEAVHGVIRTVLGAADTLGATEAFRAFHRLAVLRRETEPLWERFHCLLLPAAPTIYRADEIEQQPLELNARLGYYTNFANLLGLAAVNVPGGMRSDGLPFGLSLVGPAGSERALGMLGSRLHAALALPAGAGGSHVPAPLARETGK